MRKFFLMLCAIFCATIALWAQTPNWASRASKSLCSIVTYDAEGNIKGSGNGFFIDERGTLLSDYTLFKGAHRAVVFDANNQQFDVEYILGASDMFDIVKCRIATSQKTIPLTMASSAAAVESDIYLLPYATQKNLQLKSGKVLASSEIDGDQYYTLSVITTDKLASCPIVNAAGEVVALMQRYHREQESYAVGVHYAAALSINPFVVRDFSLDNIAISKALPEDEQQALAYIMIGMGVRTNEEQIALLNRFIMLYPHNSEAYLRRAKLRAEMEQYRPAVADYNEYHRLEEGNVTASFHYQRAMAELQCRMNLQAIDDLKAAVAADGQEVNFRVQLITTYLRFHLYQEAQAAIEQGITLFPEEEAFAQLLDYCREHQANSQEEMDEAVTEEVTVE